LTERVDDELEDAARMLRGIGQGRPSAVTPFSCDSSASRDFRVRCDPLVRGRPRLRHASSRALSTSRVWRSAGAVAPRAVKRLLGFDSQSLTQDVPSRSIVDIASARANRAAVAPTAGLEP
jgi:hypothetical protein